MLLRIRIFVLTRWYRLRYRCNMLYAHELVKLIKLLFIDARLNDPFHQGLCLCVKQAFCSIMNIPINFSFEQMNTLLPEFKYDGEGTKAHNQYWWPISDMKSRLEYLDRLYNTCKENKRLIIPSFVKEVLKKQLF